MRPRHERIGPPPSSVDRPATATYPAGAVLHERVLDVHELVWVLRGAAVVHGPGGVERDGAVEAERELRPGHVLLVPPGSAHGFRWGSPDGAVGCVHGYVHADLDAALVAPRPVVVSASPGDPLPGLLAYLLWLGVHEPPGWRGRALQTAGLVADLVVQGPLPRPAGPSPAPVVEALLGELRRRWVAGPPLRAVGVAELAAALHVSPAHVSRSVRRAYGRPLSTLLEQLRISRVELLLTGTSLTVAAVARLCGYADAFHCSRRFAAAHGQPPGRYRTSSSRSSVLDDPVVRAVADAVWGQAGA